MFVWRDSSSCASVVSGDLHVIVCSFAFDFVNFLMQPQVARNDNKRVLVYNAVWFNSNRCAAPILINPVSNGGSRIL